MEMKPILKKVLQVGIVVKNLEEAIEKYNQCGIGPWKILDCGPSNISNLTIRGQQIDYSFRIALTKIGDFNWELIEPLDEKSIYADFLKQHGEGVHHIAFDVDGYNETLTFFESKGIGVQQGGKGFAYLDSEKLLSCVVEIYDRPPKKG